ncbi:hypothetical protein NRIC_29250 [Enterococcus florum]|uniref:Bacteriophage lysin domain-containing protein n=1 Tax=Enterococcus florum TaxID=2480627 RepID=A0A4P5PEH1_9ENTE|nr:peptidoglycan amidohydrolase family protein [Enterococcus florum]GCF95034.1 hypothetical protein NRIC_29250 [Enterococcus florum]
MQKKMIGWFEARSGEVTYSLVQCLGLASYDRSSAVYLALISAGFLSKETTISNTDSLYRLEKRLLESLS